MFSAYFFTYALELVSIFRFYQELDGVSLVLRHSSFVHFLWSDHWLLWKTLVPTRSYAPNSWVVESGYQPSPNLNNGWALRLAPIWNHLPRPLARVSGGNQRSSLSLVPSRRPFWRHSNMPAWFVPARLQLTCFVTRDQHRADPCNEPAELCLEPWIREYVILIRAYTPLYFLYLNYVYLFLFCHFDF